MDKNKRKQKNIGPLKRYMKNKAKQNTLKAIKYWEKKYNRELSPEERKDLYIKEQKKLMLENKKKFNRIKVGLAAGVLSISSFLRVIKGSISSAKTKYFFSLIISLMQNITEISFSFKP